MAINVHFQHAMNNLEDIRSALIAAIHAVNGEEFTAASVPGYLASIDAAVVRIRVFKEDILPSPGSVRGG